MTELHQFSLYDRLSKFPVQKEINTTRLAEKIRSLQKLEKGKVMSVYENILMIIIHHHYIKTGILSENPYCSRTCPGGKGVIFTLTVDFPIELLHILDNYLDEITNIR